MHFSKTYYNKQPTSIDEQISLLKDRNLIINDRNRAKKYLTNIGYFRLSGYMYHLQKSDGSHIFNENTTFNDIISHYNFDKKLRFIILEYLERIEVALRAMLTNFYSLEYGFFWYNIFQDCYDNNEESEKIFDTIFYEIDNHFNMAKEVFFKSFKKKYDNDLPPSNMAMEVLSFGQLSSLFRVLKPSNPRKEICTNFNLSYQFLNKWFTYLSSIRNICAHHGRLWNKKIIYNRPPIPTKGKFKFKGSVPSDFDHTLYGVISIIDRLLKYINPNNSFIEKILSLIEEYPMIDVEKMGFPNDYKNNPAWI